MAKYILATILLLTAAVCTVVAQAQAPAPEKYAWAESCRNCHQAAYDAWAKTKHATALDRLSAGDQEKDCVTCHVTGPKTRVLDGRKVLNRGVQCEACHGAAADHAEDPSVRTGLVRVPSEAVCVECHSDKSPRYKGFFYGAMLGLSHRAS